LTETKNEFTSRLLALTEKPRVSIRKLRYFKEIFENIFLEKRKRSEEERRLFLNEKKRRERNNK